MPLKDKEEYRKYQREYKREYRSGYLRPVPPASFDPVAYMRVYNNLPTSKMRTSHWHRDRDLRQFYGLTFDDFVALAARTDDQCPICGVNPATHVDHDHDTGKIRGIICNGCNRMLGRLDSRKGMLERIVKYYGK